MRVKLISEQMRGSSVVININDMIDEMTDDDKGKIAKILSMEESLMDSIVGQLVHGCTEEGFWNSPEFVQKLRLNVVELLPEIEVMAVKQILTEAKYSKAEKDRMSAWAWDLYRHIENIKKEQNIYISSPAIPDWMRPELTTDKEAQQKIEDAKAGVKP